MITSYSCLQSFCLSPKFRKPGEKREEEEEEAEENAHRGNAAMKGRLSGYNKSDFASNF